MVVQSRSATEVERGEKLYNEYKTTREGVLVRKGFMTEVDLKG